MTAQPEEHLGALPYEGWTHVCGAERQLASAVENIRAGITQAGVLIAGTGLAEARTLHPWSKFESAHWDPEDELLTVQILDGTDVLERVNLKSVLAETVSRVFGWLEDNTQRTGARPEHAGPGRFPPIFNTGTTPGFDVSPEGLRIYTHCGRSDGGGRTLDWGEVDSLDFYPEGVTAVSSNSNRYVFYAGAGCGRPHLRFG